MLLQEQAGPRDLCNLDRLLVVPVLRSRKCDRSVGDVALYVRRGSTIAEAVLSSVSSIAHPSIKTSFTPTCIDCSQSLGVAQCSIRSAATARPGPERQPCPASRQSALRRWLVGALRKVIMDLGCFHAAHRRQRQGCHSRDNDDRTESKASMNHLLNQRSTRCLMLSLPYCLDVSEFRVVTAI